MALVCCFHCGTTLGSGTFCTYCGARVVRPNQTPRTLLAATAPSRFDLVQRSPGYELATKYEPNAPIKAKLLPPAILILLSIAFVIAGASMLSDAGTDLVWKMAFLTAPALLVIGAIAMLVKAERVMRAPVERDIVVVVDERLEVNGRVERPRKSYFATVQRRDGRRAEYRTFGWLAGRISPTDIGVAYVKGDHLVDFVRLEAPYSSSALTM